LDNKINCQTFLIEIITPNINSTRMRLLSLLFTAFLAVQTIGVSAQADLSSMFDTLSLKNQFEYVYDKSESYERYKVVKMATLNLLKKSSIDSVTVYKEQLKQRTSEIDNLKSTIETKDGQIKELSENLDATTTSKNSMVLLGAEISKGLYGSIMWGLVAGLLVFVVVLFLMFKRSNSITSETKSRLKEVEEEFENHRKSALKREQKIARELMDEKLKHKF